MAKRRRGVEVAPEDKRKVSKEGLNNILGIFRYILPYKWYFFVGMVFLLLSTAATLALPYLLGELLNSAVPDFSSGMVSSEEISSIDIRTDEINKVGLILGGLLVAQAIFSFFRIYLFAQVSERSMADIRASAYRKLITLPIVFFEERRVGELTSRLSSDVTQLQDILSTSLAEFLRQIMTLIGGVIILVWVSPQLTLFMLGTFPFMIIAALFFGKFIRKLSKSAQDQLADANTIVEETFQSVSIVKAFANEGIEVKRYVAALKRVVNLFLKAALFRGGFVSFITIAIFGGIILVIWRGAHLINEDGLQVGQLLMFVLYTTFIGASVAGIGDLYGQLQKTIGASERLRDILGETPEFELEDDIAIARPEGNISFRDVEFAYPTRLDVEVLKGINLDIKPGEKIALVGHSGAGKSTIAQLLLRFYDTQKGAITVDGKDYGSYPVQAYRRHLGLVPQEVILFGGTIGENIAYGRPGASEEDILAAAKRANATEFIERFPEGLDTLVGERGVKLSGGQRQRLAIARAILKDPAILILDEATSSLDAESESLVQEALNELMRGRTTIIIAHRLSTIREVDRIYVIDDGRIREQGTHSELAAQDGVYSNLLNLQMS
ncbi:MAG: ABC transporter ATP-binding protein [Bacteroidia bacterium]